MFWYMYFFVECYEQILLTLLSLVRRPCWVRGGGGHTVNGVFYCEVKSLSAKKTSPGVFLDR